MKTKHVAWILLLAAMVGCSRDPEVVKRRYLESGNKYMKEGKLKEASIMYRSAIKRDPRFGEAYAKLGEVELRRGNYPEAVSALRRAVDLVPNDPTPGAKLGDIYLAAYAGSPRRDSRLLSEAKLVADELSKRNPKSYEGLRLRGLTQAVDGEFPGAVDSFKAADAVRPDQPDLLFALVQALTADQRFDEAEKIAKQVIEKHKNFGPMYEFLFGQYLRRNRAPEAEKMLDLKIQNNPKVVGYQLQKAAYFYATRRMDQAQPILQHLVEDSADFPTGRDEVADFYFRTREYEKAQKLFEEGIQKDPKRKNQIRMRLMLVKVAQNRFDEAMAIVAEVLKDEPNNNDALQARSALALQAGDDKQRQQAMSDLQTLSSRLPQNAVVRFNLGRAYAQKGEWEAARVQYQEAVKNRPDFLPAHLGLAQSYAVRGDFGKAIQETDETLKIQPNFVQAKILRANLLLLTGSFKAARGECEQILKVFPNQTETKFILAGVEIQEKQYAKAEEIFKSLITVTPTDRRLHIALAQVYAVTNRMPLALSYIEEQIKKIPEAIEFRVAHADLAERAKKYDVAEQEYNDLLAKDPKNYQYYRALGELYRKTGDLKKSYEVLKKGQEIAPANPTANLELAMTMEAQGIRGEAKALYENIIKVQPNNPVALNNLAYIMAEEGGDLDVALTYAQRAKQQLPNSDDVSDTLGWIYIKKNLSDNAITIFKGLTDKQPNNATFHFHLGMALFQKGDKVKAKQSLQTALAKNPPKDVEPKIRELLGRIG